MKHSGNQLILPLILGFLCGFTFFGCNTEKEINYYPSKVSLREFELVDFEIDTTSLNFAEMTKLVYKNFENNKRIVIGINNENIQKKISPTIFSELKKRNVLSITSDSILIDDGYSISELKPILKRHYSNNDRKFNYPKSYSKAVVEITLDTNATKKDLKQTLIRLTRTFDEINLELKDSLELRTYLSIFRQIPPPPSPK